MQPSRQSGGRRGPFVAAAATALLALGGVSLVGAGFLGSDGPPPVAAATSTSPSGRSADVDDTAVRTPRTPQEARTDEVDFGHVLPGSPPVALDIPSIDVSSTNLVGLGLAKDGSLEVPRDASAPGWFTPGPSPGQFGPAVIAGHVDSEDGPAVFYRLSELERGDRVHVTREDGSTATFVIDRVEDYEKDEFPTHEVYGNTTDRAELRLITCGGQYDDETGYLNNTVAFAHLVR